AAGRRRSGQIYLAAVFLHWRLFRPAATLILRGTFGEGEVSVTRTGRTMMKRVTRWALVLIAGALLAAWATPAPAQSKEKVYRSITTAQLENIFNGLGIKFTKTQPKNLPNDWDYDFDRNNYKIRFTLSNGKLLWLSAFFPKSSLEKINAWNVDAKFS